MGGGVFLFWHKQISFYKTQSGTPSLKKRSDEISISEFRYDYSIIFSSIISADGLGFLWGIFLEKKEGSFFR